MNGRISRIVVSLVIAAPFSLPGSAARAEDWPQWRGANRDGHVVGFAVPKAWPKELAQKWKVPVGEGVATPALVGGKLFVFSWEEGKEITRCLEADTGKPVWKEEYDSARATRPAQDFAGARSSPTVADGRVVTYGAHGVLSCLDAATGKKVWRKEDLKGTPRFLTSSSPIVAAGLCVTQYGGEGKGGIAAYNLADGAEKWKWTDESAAYASPALLTVDGTKMIVAETDKSIVGIDLAAGKLLWKIPFAVTGRGYNASTPVVEGKSVVFSGTGRGTRAIAIEKAGAEFAAKDLWTNKDNSVIYNTPVWKGNLIFGLTANNNLYCLHADSGKEAWTAPIKGKGGYGSIVDVGPALMALTPNAQLIVFESSDREFKQLASYKVAGGDTYAYPVVAGNRVYIKDKDSVILWAFE